MYEYTRLLEPRYLLGSVSDMGGIDCEKLHDRLEELEYAPLFSSLLTKGTNVQNRTRALHPKASDNTTSQRKQERHDTIIGDLGSEEQQPAQAKSERKELPSKQNIFERDSQCVTCIVIVACCIKRNLKIARLI